MTLEDWQIYLSNVEVLGISVAADVVMAAVWVICGLCVMVYRERIVLTVGDRLFVVKVVAFTWAQMLAHLLHALDRYSETISIFRLFTDVVSVIAGVALVLSLPHALKQMSRLSQEAAEALRAKAELKMRDTFISVAAHELKTPITSISGFGQVIGKLIELGEAGANPQNVLSKLEAQSQSIQRMTTLVDRLLDYSRISSGKLKLQISAIDIGKLVYDSARDVGYRHPGVQIEVSGPESLLFHGDYTRLYQVLVNLIDNAAKFTTYNVEVEFGNREHDGVFVRVCDRGPGINEDMKGHIFEAYQQASERYFNHGLGLGLAISHEIAVLHKGTLTVADREGGGSVFELWLPDGSPDEENSPSRPISGVVSSG